MQIKNLFRVKLYKVQSTNMYTQQNMKYGEKLFAAWLKKFVVIFAFIQQKNSSKKYKMKPLYKNQIFISCQVMFPKLEQKVEINTRLDIFERTKGKFNNNICDIKNKLCVIIKI